MKDVITNTSLIVLTPQELQHTFGGSDDQATVLDVVFDSAGVAIVEDLMF